tara:strand:+ start:746 stop:2248 length:1503 start_codon:yes stop_codon:yes gene_type:complete
MGRYENPQVTIIDPSKNLKAFQNNFDKAYAAVDAYRKEKRAKEERYENEVFAVGNKMYEKLDAAELYNNKGEEALFDSVKAGTDFIMQNKLNKTEQLTLAKSHGEVVGVLNNFAQGVFVTPLELDKTNINNQTWMELSSAMENKNVDVKMVIDDSGRQARYVGEISYTVDGKTKTMSHNQLATLLGNIQASSADYKNKKAKVDTKIKNIIGIANQRQEEKDGMRDTNTTKESIKEALDQGLGNIDQEEVEFIFENLLNSTQQGNIEEGKNEDVRRREKVNEWYKSQITGVKANRLRAKDPSNFSARIASSNNTLANIHETITTVLNREVQPITKIEFGILDVPGPSQEVFAQAREVNDYEAMADVVGQSVASTINKVSTNANHIYLGRAEALKNYVETKQQVAKINSPDEEPPTVASITNEFNKKFPRKTTGENSVPEIFRMREASDGKLKSFPYRLEVTNAADMTKETLQSMGIFNYDPAYFATVTGGSTTPTDRGKGL